MAPSVSVLTGFDCIECFHSRGQHLCTFIGTKESVYIRKELNSHRTGLGHQYGRREVMWKHPITYLFICQGSGVSDKQVVQEISTGLFDSGTDLFRNTLLISATCTIAAVVLGLCFDAVRRIRQRAKVDQNKGESVHCLWSKRNATYS